MRKVAFHTLGCKVNQTETQGLAALFRERGYEVVPFRETADVYVVNTCTVTRESDRKSRQVVRRAVRSNPAALVVVIGCYAQVAPAEAGAMPGVSLVVGTSGRGRIVDLVEQAAARKKGSDPFFTSLVLSKCPDPLLKKGSDPFLAGPFLAVDDIEQVREFEDLPEPADPGRARAFLKVQEGCRDFCTYCIVPYARGPLRSRPPERVFELARGLVDRGYPELVLTGVNLGAYGRDLGTENLPSLVRRLVRIPGLVRLRLSSLEPNEITRELVEVVAENPVCAPHFHIPLQSGSDAVLSRMGRRYSTGEFGGLIDTIRGEVPEVAVTADVMVGFPGETAAEHRESLEYVRRTGFAGLHVFVYSPRRGTPAASFPDPVPHRVKKERSREMLALGRELRDRFASRYLGRTVEVLVESVSGGVATGYTPNYLRVFFKNGPEFAGRIAKVYADGAEQGNLRGIIQHEAGLPEAGVK